LNKFSNTIQTYLNKFSTTTKLIKTPVNTNCKQIIVIPSYCEPDLIDTLQSLSHCEETVFNTEIIVVLNCSETDSAAKTYHEKQLKIVSEEYKSGPKLNFHFINVYDLPQKHAGVGLARKTGMDEAVRRFDEIGYDGMIVCLDADCTVGADYLKGLEKYSGAPEKYNSICLHFEHNIEKEKNEDLKLGIIYYELFLRYYKDALTFCNFPYNFYTIGSSMAVKTSTYCKAGGMNKRKAGEDFYFLQKVFPYGKVIELNSVTVFPSSRISSRVPFGTGRAQQNFIDRESGLYSTYNFKTFEDLKTLFDFNFYSKDFPSETNYFSPAIKSFLSENNFSKKLTEIKCNTNSEQQFRKRFFNWLDGFMILKFVHFARDNFYPDESLETGLQKLFPQLKINTDLPRLLIELRRRQRNIY